MSVHLSMALTIASIAFAFFYPVLFMRNGTQPMMAELPPRAPLPKYGTDDPRDFAAALHEPTIDAPRLVLVS
jgi:hypothetical protein